MSMNTEDLELQNMPTIIAFNKQKIKNVKTKIYATKIRNRMSNVLIKTMKALNKSHNNVQNIRLKTISKYKQNFQDSYKYQCEIEFCKRCQKFARLQYIQRVQYRKCILDHIAKSQQIKSKYYDLKKIYLDIQQNDFNQFEGLQFTQQLDFVGIKNQVLEVNDLYERGKLKLVKLNQIFIQFYNLSLQPCGICLVQPTIDQVMILECGHSLCETCFTNFRRCERDKIALRRCPFCRQQIEFIVKEEIMENK